MSQRMSLGVAGILTVPTQSRTKECYSTSGRVIRYFGLNFSRRQTRSMAQSLTSLNQQLDGIFLILAGSNSSLACSVFSDCISWLLGQPTNASIFSICSNIVLPENIALPASISPSIHPKLHKSVSFEYLRLPNIISGDRYHLVATNSVMVSSSPGLTPINLDSPKSHSFIEQSEFIKMLAGLRSRCRIYDWCRKRRDWAIWQVMKRMWGYCSMFYRITEYRSHYMQSKIRYRSRSLSAFIVYFSRTKLGCGYSFRNMLIQRQVRCASLTFLNASNIFLRARTCLVLLQSTFHTCPQDPLPTFSSSVYLLITWSSTFSSASCSIQQNITQDHLQNLTSCRQNSCSRFLSLSVSNSISSFFELILASYSCRSSSRIIHSVDFWRRSNSRFYLSLKAMWLLACRMRKFQSSLVVWESQLVLRFRSDYSRRISCLSQEMLYQRLRAVERQAQRRAIRRKFYYWMEFKEPELYF